MGVTDKGKTKVRVSAAAARYLHPGTSREERLKAARGEAGLTASDTAIVQFCLSRDQDPQVRTSAVAGLGRLPEEQLLEIAGSAETHPRFLELIARLHGVKPAVAERIALNPAADAATLSFIPLTGESPVGELHGKTAGKELPASAAEEAASSGSCDEEGEETADQEEEAFRNTYQLAKDMSVSEKIKMALTGDKEWRMLLVKDINKLVSGSVVKNPRITEAEVLMISKSHLNNDDILRDICINKDWTKNYQIRKSLVENHKTPLHFALRFLSGLTDKDLGVLAKSKNVSSVISTQARRLLMNKQKEK